MATKQLATLAALVCMSAPCMAWDAREAAQPATFFYFKVPLDVATKKEQVPYFGFAIQGRREWQSLNLDTRMLNFVELGALALDAKWIIAGGVAVAGVAVASRKDKGVQQQYQQQAAQQAVPAVPCPKPPEDPCKP
jgi:hypothetical protein